MLLLAETEWLTAAGEFERALLAAERLAERAARTGAEEFAGAA
jgi:hypothetical protein